MNFKSFFQFDCLLSRFKRTDGYNINLWLCIIFLLYLTYNIQSMLNPTFASFKSVKPGQSQTLYSVSQAPLS